MADRPGQGHGEGSVHPELAHMVVKDRPWFREAATDLAAFVQTRWSGPCAGCDISLTVWQYRSARSRIQASAKQIKQILSIKADTTAHAGMLVALAWPDRIAQKRGGDRRYRYRAVVVQFFLSMTLAKRSGSRLPQRCASGPKIFLAAPLALAEYRNAIFQTD